jgi:hypothetical protein
VTVPARQLTLPFVVRPGSRRWRTTAASPVDLDPSLIQPVQQPELPLVQGAVADTPPWCSCCQTRGCIPAAEGGWTTCTWCDGTRIDPPALAARVAAACLLGLMLADLHLDQGVIRAWTRQSSGQRLSEQEGRAA